MNRSIMTMVCYEQVCFEKEPAAIPQKSKA